MSSVSSLPALLPAQHGFIQGQISRCIRECLETSLAFNEDYVNKFKMPRGIISESLGMRKRIKMPSNREVNEKLMSGKLEKVKFDDAF